ncbi:MAG: PmoA family protein [Planctomycetia bacterium]|nr:PmoA family protein [Planctomycetia bacterium]
MFRSCILVCVALSSWGSVVGAEEKPASELSPPKPVPAMQVEPLPHSEARFLHHDRELIRYHFAADDRRPFLYPVVGPSGRSLTRMGHPRDPVGHSHHNSIWISHHIVNGVNFWGDAGPKLGRIVTKQIEQLDDADDSAWLTALNHWIDEEARTVLLVERRRIEVRPLNGKDYLIVVDLELSADKQPTVLEKTPFGLVGVRMRKTIGVHDGGGRILNSAGAVNEKGIAGKDGVFWKPARWCDYSGPVTATATEGLTLFDHPMNPNHPTVFHVRDDGWMGASLTFAAPRTLEPGKPLRLRYGFYIHDKLLDVPTIDGQWQAFSKLPSLDTLVKPKPPQK